MKLTKKEFIKNVKSEIKAIKKYATDEEKQNLNFKEFNPTSYQNCIYGQIANGCRTTRAVKLIRKCCISFIHKECWLSIAAHQNTPNDCNSITKTSKEKLSGGFYFSSLELFIVDKYYQKFNRRVLQFIKGKTNTLSFIKATK